MEVYKNRKAEYSNDLLSVFIFIKNISVYAIDFAPVVSTFSFLV